MEFLKQLLYTLAYIVVSYLLGTLIFLFELVPAAYVQPLYPYALLLVYLLLLLTVALFLRWRKVSIIPKATQYTFYGIAVAFGILFVWMQDFLNGLFYLVFHENVQGSFDFDLSKLLTWTTVYGVLLGPITEELFFRRFQMGSLLKKYPMALAILCNAFLFALLHFPFEVFIYKLVAPDFVVSPLFSMYDLHHSYITFFGGLLWRGSMPTSRWAPPSSCTWFGMPWPL
ncbi:MAG: CPBP family intramembrane glutamic endopeptidase [Flavobacteriaceae bacterium]